jgi:hypothetical protein
MEDKYKNKSHKHNLKAILRYGLWSSLVAVIIFLGWFGYTTLTSQEADDAQAANTLVSLELTFDPQGDADNDGLLNGDECGNNQGQNCIDTDDDGIPDYFDVDSDDDNIPDEFDDQPTIPNQEDPTSNCGDDDELCFLAIGEDANDPKGDYYFEPNKSDIPVYNSSTTLNLVLKSDGPATQNCSDASDIQVNLLARNNKYLRDQSKWIDITTTENLSASQLATGKIPTSFRTTDGITINDRGWSFEIDLICDGKAYKGQNGYSFAVGALAVVNLSGGAI